MDNPEVHAMPIREPVRSRGFTLIELLTVIAIITLLLGVLVPTVSIMKDRARTSATEVRLKDIGQGCEAFHADFDDYPQSSGQNPFETVANARLSGAQWLALQLMGADFQGYVKPERRNDVTGDGQITDQDWRDWYDPTNTTNKVSRLGPYLDSSKFKVQTPEHAASDDGLTLPPELQTGTTDWQTDRLAYILDGFGFPILYYRANAQAKDAPFSIWSGSNERIVGCYDQRDNEAFTGCAASSVDGFDLGQGLPSSVGGMYNLGWSDATPFVAPTPKTFAAALYDRAIFQNTPGLGVNEGRVWPHRPDTFILLSPGKDSLYGTADDVKNYQQ